ncbi:PD-(D/E)XK motif protein [Sedimentibacter sp.]|uniref:PD-(D/E)XK motif protein n=1 Tax=Sedimentibacter sp. TaxID=1960295 RepID=UPI00289B93B9|nr:PD-(D/E)XK motif protein [Sedimentibacter sp.]
MKIDDLQHKWNSVPSSDTTYQRIDDEHIMDIFIGKDSGGFKELLVVSEIEPAKMRSSKSIEIQKGVRKDNRWATRIRLLKKEQEEVFTHLCWDLIEHSRSAKNKTIGLEIVIARFLKWQKLMESGSDLLPDEVIKGIIGELLYAKKKLFPLYAWDVILSAWIGPDGADKDFVFEETWSEIKAIKTGKATVTISSMEQLSSKNNGTLVIATVDNTSAADAAGFSFSEIINEFREILRASPSALFDYETKLLELGYIDRKEYFDKYYVFYGFRFYRVDADFPKLTRDCIPNEIIKVKYDIALSEIKEFEILED